MQGWSAPLGLQYARLKIITDGDIHELPAHVSHLWGKEQAHLSFAHPG